MKYIKVFAEDTDYQTFMGGGAVIKPNVSYCRKENEVHYNPLILQPNNEIWYVSTDENIVVPNPRSTTPFLDIDGNNIPIVSNTYENGKGIIKLEKDCYQIGDSAFYNCSSLTGITIPNSVTTIGRGAFSYCYSLTGITIPDSVTTIGQGAFEGWTGVTSTDNIIFPNDQLKIKYFESDYAFSAWGSLTSVTIPDSVTSIGDSAFSSCYSLTGITIPDSVTTIGQGAFAGWTGATSTDNIVFPNEQLKIKYFESNDAFNGWKSLTSVIIPDSVTSIGKTAFYNCSKLTGITIPDSVTSIEDAAFNTCRGLTSITIPNSVTSIGKYTFSYCNELSSITVLPTTLPALGSRAFDNIASNAVIYVPSTSVDNYKSASGWSIYASMIQAISE